MNDGKYYVQIEGAVNHHKYYDDGSAICVCREIIKDVAYVTSSDLMYSLVDRICNALDFAKTYHIETDVYMSGHHIRVKYLRKAQ